MCLRSQISLKDNGRVDQCWPVKADTKSYSVCLIFKLAQVLFVHSKAMAGPEVPRQDWRCLQLCWGSSWCHSWRSSGSQGDNPQLSALPSASPCQNQPREHPSLHKGSTADSLLSFQGSARDWQGLHSGSKISFVLGYRINLYHQSGIRDCQGQDKGHLSHFPSVETLCSFAGCFWIYRIIATLTQGRVPSSQLHFPCSGKPHLYPKAAPWEPVLPNLWCGYRQKQRILDIVQYSRIAVMADDRTVQPGQRQALTISVGGFKDWCPWVKSSFYEVELPFSFTGMWQMTLLTLAVSFNTN